MKKSDIPVITIDGPSGTGKGTLALKLSNWLGWNFLDSGVFYRGLAYLVSFSRASLGDSKALVALAEKMKISFAQDDDKVKVLIEGKDVTHDLRSESCGAIASKIATKKVVREALLERQKKFKSPPGLIADGRDMGTVVFPEAKLKFFLTATADERAKRRYNQLKQIGISAKLARLIEEIRKRDLRDKRRLESPLRPADDAIVVDTTTLSAEAVENWAKEKVITELNIKLK